MRLLDFKPLLNRGERSSIFEGCHAIFATNGTLHERLVACWDCCGHNELKILKYSPSFYKNGTDVFQISCNGPVSFSRFYFVKLPNGTVLHIDGRDEVIRALDRLARLDLDASNVAEYLVFVLNAARTDHELRQIVGLTKEDVDSWNGALGEAGEQAAGWLGPEPTVRSVRPSPPLGVTEFDVKAAVVDRGTVWARVFRVGMRNLGRWTGDDARVGRVRLAPLVNGGAEPATMITIGNCLVRDGFGPIRIGARPLTDPAVMSAEEARDRILAGQPVVNATVLGDIDVSNQSTLSSIQFHNVHLHGNLIADHARIQGELRLHFLVIDGILSCREATVDGVMSLRDLAVNRVSVSIQGRKHSTILLDDIVVRGAIDCVNLKVRGDVHAEGLTAHGDVIIVDPMVSRAEDSHGTVEHPPRSSPNRGLGVVSIRNGDIRGDFRLFANRPPEDNALHLAHDLKADGLDIHGDAMVCGIRIGGDLDFTDAKIAGSLLIRARETYLHSDSVREHPSDANLAYQNTPIDRAWPTEINGLLDLSHAEIADLDMRASTVGREVRMIGTQLGRMYMLPAPVVRDLPTPDGSGQTIPQLLLEPCEVGSVFAQSVVIDGNANFSGLRVRPAPVQQPTTGGEASQPGRQQPFNAGSFSLTPASIGGDLRFWRYQIIDYAVDGGREIKTLGRLGETTDQTGGTRLWHQEKSLNPFFIRTQIAVNLDLSNIEVKGQLNLNNLYVGGQIRLNDSHIHADILCESLSRSHYQNSTPRANWAETGEPDLVRLLAEILEPLEERSSPLEQMIQRRSMHRRGERFKCPENAFSTLREGRGGLSSTVAAVSDPGVNTTSLDPRSDTSPGPAPADPVHLVKLSTYCRRFECESLVCDGDAFLSGLRVGVEPPVALDIHNGRQPASGQSPARGFYRPEFDGRKMRIGGELRFVFSAVDLARHVDLNTLNDRIAEHNRDEPCTDRHFRKVSARCRETIPNVDRFHVQVAGKLDLSGSSASALIVSGDSFASSEFDNMTGSQDALEYEDEIDLSRARFHVIDIRKDRKNRFPKTLRFDDVETDRWEIEDGLTESFLRNCIYDRQMLKRMQFYYKNISDSAAAILIYRFSMEVERGIVERNGDRGHADINLRFSKILLDCLRGLLGLIAFLPVKIIDTLFSAARFLSSIISGYGLHPFRMMVLILFIWIGAFALFSTRQHVEQTPMAMVVDGSFDVVNPAAGEWGYSDAAWMASRHAVPLLNLDETRWRWGPSAHPLYIFDGAGCIIDPETEGFGCTITVEDVAYGLTFFAWVIWSVFLIQVTGFFRSPLD